MRDPRNALRPFILKATQAAREKLAAQHFDLTAVRDAITAAPHAVKARPGCHSGKPPSSCGRRGR